MSQAYSSYSSKVCISARMTALPASAQRRAATVPALPAPTTSTSQLSVSATLSMTGASPSHAGVFSMKSAGVIPSGSQPPPADSTPSPLETMYSSAVFAATLSAASPRLKVDSWLITS